MSKPRKITEAEKELLSDYFYTDSGRLFAKKAYAKRVKAGQEVGCYNGRGLIVVCDYKSYHVHRVIYFLHFGIWPSGVIDHINGNPLDNRPENLRSVTQGQNTRSYAKKRKGSTSQYRGVHWFKRDGAWQAQIMYEGQKHHLGYFLVEEEAALVWDLAAEKLGFNREALNHVF